KEFFGGVDWDYWETRQDPRCHNCKMHSGFEASVVRKLGERFSAGLTMARWQLENVRNPGRRAAESRPLRDELVGADVDRALLRAAVAVAVGRRRSGRRPGVPARRRRREVAG